MSEEKPESDDFNLPTREDVAGLFNEQSVFDKREEIIDVIYKMVDVPGLLGLDFADIRNVIAPNNNFRFIKTFLGEISKVQTAIDNSAGAIVFFTCGPDDTLGFVEGIIEKHFSKTKAFVSQCIINPKAKSGNPKLEIILANR